MALLYHMNHSSDSCDVGSVYDLIPWNINSALLESVEFIPWAKGFPAGLSQWGMRILTPSHGLPELVGCMPNMEWKCEEIRQRFFPRKNSRYQSFYGFESIPNALDFRDKMASHSVIAGSIWEIEVATVHHIGDMNLLKAENCNDEIMKLYWAGDTVNKANAIWECLALPPVRFIRRVEP